MTLVDETSPSRWEKEPRYSQTSFLEGLRLDYGPVPSLSLFLLKSETYLRNCGIQLSLDSIATIAAKNAREFASWGRFAPQLDTRLVNISDQDSYSMVGRDQAGNIVATQAGRVYDTGSRSLKDIADDRSLYYGVEPPPCNGLTCELTAPAAAMMRGRLVYSGALWVHPSFRGQKVASILPRASRAYALGRWNTDYTFAFIGAAMASSPLLSMYGYRRVEPSYTFYEAGQPIYTGALMWMGTEELVTDLEEFGSSGFFEVDGSVRDSSGQRNTTAVG